MAAEDNQSLVSTNSNDLENIKVAVRLRPFTEKERQRNNRRIVDIEQNTVVLYNPAYGDVQLKKFTFDYSYWSHDGFKKNPETGVNVPDLNHSNYNKYVGQEKVFNDLGKFLLKNTLEGYNSALLAYGPTGSGKSYTVSGYGQNEGILPRFARALFAQLEAKKIKPPASSTNEPQVDQEINNNNIPEDSKTTATTPLSATGADYGGGGGCCECTNNRYEIYFSMIEIYNEVVRDLLSKTNQAANGAPGRRGLKVREHPKEGFFVENLSSYLCSNQGEIERRIVEGQLNKSIAATSMNETSSRGHTIYEFTIKQYKLKNSSTNNNNSNNNNNNQAASMPAAASSGAEEEILTTSVVQLVDLAGSERMAVHAVTNQFDLMMNNSSSGNTLPTSRSNSPFPGAVAGGGSQIRARSSTRAAAAPASATSTSTNITAGSGNLAATDNQTISQQGSSMTMKRGRAMGPANTSNYKKRFKESISINQSLSALGNCIQVMSQHSQQLETSGGGGTNALAGRQRPAPKIPYRDSVLTKLLNRCCLSGNSKVVIIATLSPVDTSYDDTLSTLRFADRAKRIRTHATINRMSRGRRTGGGQMVEELQRENERLKQMVDNNNNNNNNGRVTRSDDSSQTSNFDDSENVAENFTGSKINSAAAAAAAAATRTVAAAAAISGSEEMAPPPPVDGSTRRSRTISRKNPVPSENHAMQGAQTLGKGRAGATTTTKNATTKAHEARPSGGSRIPAPGSSLSSSLQEQQLRRLVSPAVTTTNKTHRSSQRNQPKDDDDDEDDDDVEIELSELADINESANSLISDAESDDDSAAALAAVENELLQRESGGDQTTLDMSNEEKIDLFNRMLSNSMTSGGGGARLQAHPETSSSSMKKSSTTAKGMVSPTAGSEAAVGATRKRPKKANNRQRILNRAATSSSHGGGGGAGAVSSLSDYLKKTNPYLSNLNQDEQLTGVINYMIKEGETVIGKSGAECDIVLHGPELRAKHAKIIRLAGSNNKSQATTVVVAEDTSKSAASLDEVFIEPILSEPTTTTTNEQKDNEKTARNNPKSDHPHSSIVTAHTTALKLNGLPVTKRTPLHHCDRLLFGTNAYYVFVNNPEHLQEINGKVKPPPDYGSVVEGSIGFSYGHLPPGSQNTGERVTNLDMVTYDMASQEVMRKVLNEATNEAVIKEIKDYTHRPGTGKHRASSNRSAMHTQQQEQDSDRIGASGVQSTQDKKTSAQMVESTPVGGSQKPKLGSSKLPRSTTIHNNNEPPLSVSAEEELDKSNNKSEEQMKHDERTLRGEEKSNAQAGIRGLGEAKRNSVAGLGSTLSKQEANYRDKLMEDTYEYAMPVTEVNAVAKELGVKVTYGLKILTGEEQLLEGHQLPLGGLMSAGSGSGIGNYYYAGTGDSSVASSSALSEDSTAHSDTNNNNNNNKNNNESSDSELETRLTKLDHLDQPPALFIRVHFEESGFEFYWSKEKFQARRYKILELYGLWDVGGKSALVEHLIDQSKIENYYLSDPFVDDPAQSFVLIGHAQITLQPLSHLADMIESYDIIDVNDELVGSIKIQAIPCHASTSDNPSQNTQDNNNNNDPSQQHVPYIPYTEEELSQNLLHDPKELLNKKLVVLLRIISCANLPQKYVNIFCQYTLKPEPSPSVRTKMLRVENYEHLINANLFGGSLGETSNARRHHQRNTTATSSGSASTSLDAGAEREQQTGSPGGLPEAGGSGGQQNTFEGGGGGEGGEVGEMDRKEETDLLQFEHQHFLVFELVNQDILDFLEHGFLTIQVVGQYRLDKSNIGSRQASIVSTIISSINKYKSRMEQQQQQQSGNQNYSFYNTTSSSSKSGPRNASSSGRIINSNSGASSVVSNSNTVNMFDREHNGEDDDEGMASSSVNGMSQENMIDMILTKRKLDRAENQLHYIKRTVNIAEHYNKKHIPVKTVKKLLNSYVHELDSGSLEEMAAETTVSKTKPTSSKNSTCIIQ